MGASVCGRESRSITATQAWQEGKRHPCECGCGGLTAGLFVPGHAVEVSAGNAGGVNITVDGHDRGRLGAHGVVVTKTYKP